MSHEFDKDFWEEHWGKRPADAPAAMWATPPSPYLARETEGLAPGTALDAGCGAGAEAIWLASAGWQVTAADISRQALAIATERAAASGVADRIRWVEADLGVWTPDTGFDLVMSHYAHPAMPQLEFYDRIAAWVNPGGTLLLVGHLHRAGVTGHDHHPPAAASVTAASVSARLDPVAWRIDTAEELTRAIPGRDEPLHDVLVRATRRT
jgi:2-polyprenyl-3-methyl-5-hydroxy-6-metoxy-1,4-benzoquinol methylase